MTTVQQRTLGLALGVASLTLIPTATTLAPAVAQLLAFAGLLAAAFLLLRVSEAPAAKRVLSWAETTRSRAARWFLAGSPWQFAVCLFAVELAVAAAGSSLLFSRTPHIQDSGSQLFHAAIIRAGLVAAPAPPLPEFFDHTHMIMTPHWYSQYPPGHLLSLAVGLAFGASWLVNPVLGAASLVLLYLIGREIYDELTGRVAAGLGVLSPMILIMSSEYMNHATALFAFCIFVFGFVRAQTKRSPVAGLVAGAGLGWLVATRPLTAFALALPFVFRSASQIWSRPKPRVVVPFLAISVSTLLCLAGVLAFNQKTTGSATTFGYQMAPDMEQSVGFGGRSEGTHTPMRGLAQARVDLSAMNFFLLRWPIPAYVLVALAFGVARRQEWDDVLLGSMFCLSLAYVFYWYQALAMGPRNIYESVLPLLLLASRGLLALPKLVQKLVPARTLGDTRALVWLAVLASVALGLVWSTHQLHKYRVQDFHGVDPSFAAAMRRSAPDNALIFVGPKHYRSVFPQNDPLLDGSVIYVRDLGEENGRMLAEFPERDAYLEEDGQLVPMGRPGGP